MQLAFKFGFRIQITASGLDVSSLLLSDSALLDRKNLLATDLTRGLDSASISAGQYHPSSFQQVYTEWIRTGKSQFVWRKPYVWTTSVR